MKIKELLESTQPIAYRTIYNSFYNKKTSHAYLIEGSVGSPIIDTALFLAQSFLCEKDVLCCEECSICKRVKENSYPDLTIISSEEGKEIKVDEINTLQENFSLTSMEGNKKIYIIHLVEKANLSAVNKLLKFLEEPSNDIVAILTTQNISKVLPTVISRCQLIRLVPPSKNVLFEQLRGDFDLNDAYILSNFCSSKDEVESLVANTNYNSIKDMAYDSIRYCLEDTKHLMFYIINSVEKFLRNNEEYLLYLDLIALYFREMITNKDGDLTYRLKNKTNIDLINALQQTLVAYSKISTRANSALIIDQLFNNIMKKEG